MTESRRQRQSTSSVRQKRVALYGIAKKRTVSYDGEHQDPLMLAELSTKARKGLANSQFAIPEKREYPIHDLAHARNALARVAQFGTPDEKRRVRAAVARKFPNIGGKKPVKGGK